jgi:hypothetical protein
LDSYWPGGAVFGAHGIGYETFMRSLAVLNRL